MGRIGTIIPDWHSEYLRKELPYDNLNRLCHMWSGRGESGNMKSPHIPLCTPSKVCEGFGYSDCPDQRGVVLENTTPQTAPRSHLRDDLGSRKSPFNLPRVHPAKSWIELAFPRTTVQCQEKASCKSFQADILYSLTSALPLRSGESCLMKLLCSFGEPQLIHTQACFVLSFFLC